MKKLALCGRGWGGGVWVIAVFTVAAAAVAADNRPAADRNWPQWRGPFANGMAPEGSNPPLNWDESTNIKWKVKLPGRGTSTPIIWNDQVFVLTAIKTDREIEEPKAGEEKPAGEQPDAKKPAPSETRTAAQESPDATKKGDAPAKSGDAPKAGDNPRPEGGPRRGPGGGGRMGGRMGGNKPKNYYQFVVMAIDRRTGETRWQDVAKEDVPHEGHHPDGSFASSSPMTDGKHLYVSFGSRGVYCYTLDGRKVWERDLGRMKILNTFGEGSSPVVHGDAVVVNWDHQGGSFIICLDAATGETRWKVDREEGTSWATPLILEKDGRTQVVTNGAKRVRSYDIKTGEVIWECGGQAPSAIPCPVSDGELAFAMTGFMGNACYAIPLNSVGDITKEESKIAWKRKSPGTPYVPSPLLDGDLLYFTSGNKGILSVLNKKTGEPLIDRTRLQGVDNVYASPVGAGDRVYFTSREGNTVVIKRGGELEILATNKLDDRFDGSAAVAGNQMFLRGENLYCISAE